MNLDLFRGNRRVFRTVLGIGLHSDEDRRLLVAINAAKTLLTLVSGYNTYYGLCEMMPPPVALLTTAGIQILLFVAASRLVTVLQVGRSVIATVSIYTITAIVSISFAYLSLDHRLNSTNVIASKQGDQLGDLAHLLMTTVSKATVSGAETSKRDTIKSFQQWQSAILGKAASLERDIGAELAQAELTEKEKSAEHKAEIAKGGTRYKERGRWKYSRGGDGDIARALEVELKEAGTRTALSRAKLERCRTVRQEIDSHASDAMRPAGFASRTKINGICLDLTALSSDPSDNTHCPVPTELEEGFGNLIASEGVESILNSPDCSLRDRDNPDLWLDRIDRCTDRLAAHVDVSTFKAKLDDARAQVLRMTHSFSASVRSLLAFDMLSLAAFFIAVAIDGLILLCSILGARPINFLQVRSTKDLNEFQELAISIMLRCGTLGQLAHVEGSLAREASRLLAVGEIVRDAARIHFGLIISPDQMQKFPRQIASFLSMDLCVPVEQVIGELQERLDLTDVDTNTSIARLKELSGGVALRTRFVLWLSNQVALGIDVSRSTDELESTVQSVLRSEGKFNAA